MSVTLKKIATTVYNGASKGVKSINGEIKSTVQYMGQNAAKGWNQGDRLSQIKKLSSIESTAVKTRGAIRQTKIRKDDLPAIIGGAGLFTPFPLASVAGYGLGKLLKLLIK